MRSTTATTIETAPSVAFDAMADARNEIYWNSQVSASELIGEEPIAEGSEFRTVNRGKEYSAAITTFDRPKRLAFEVSGSAMDITATFAFEPIDDGVSLRGEFDMRPKGVMSLMLPLMGPKVRKDLAAQSRSFAAFCERP